MLRRGVEEGIVTLLHSRPEPRRVRLMRLAVEVGAEHPVIAHGDEHVAQRRREAG
nr:hypothetical protein [Dermacoccus nishinomiyaensis]